PGSSKVSIRSRTNIFFCSACRARPEPPLRADASSPRSCSTSASIERRRSRNSAEEVSIWVGSCSISREEKVFRPTPGALGPSAHGFLPLSGLFLNELDQRLGWRPRQEDLSNSELLQRGDVLVRNDSAGDHENVFAALFLQKPHHFRKQGVVSSRKYGEPDDVHVLLDGGRGDLLRRLAQPGIDDLHPCVPQGSSDHLGASVVSVQTWLRDQDADRPSHL